MSFSNQLTAQHRATSALFAALWQVLPGPDWPAAAEATELFITDLEAHLSYEERVLFPALEAASSDMIGPTSVMRSEHRQMVELMGSLRTAVVDCDAVVFEEALQLLFIVMQQHNAKEESVLYPIADRVLATVAPQQAIQHQGTE